MHDLIVIGGGPGGASAAWKAAADGLDVLLFEKKRFPREKPCGGALSALALSYLAREGWDLPAELIENEVYGARVKLGGEAIEAARPHRIAVLTARESFDMYLLEGARAGGAEIRFEKVVDFAEDGAGGCVRATCAGGREYRARYLVVAEGAQGRLQDKVEGGGGKGDRYGFGVVTRAGLDGPGASFIDERLIQLEFGIVPGGYGWVFPYRDFCSVGLFGPAGVMKHARRKCLEYLRRCGFSPEEGSPMKGHLIPYGGPQKKLAGRRTLLCGDAGGFVDAFSGEGIGYAIRSGQIAAEKIKEALQEGGGGAPVAASYERACREEFGENLHYSRVFARHMHRHPELFFKVFAGDGELMNHYLDIAVQRATYKKVLFRLASRVPSLLKGR